MTKEIIPQAYEIVPGMTSEEMKALFFDDKAIQEQPRPVYRLDSSGHRYYYTFDEHLNPEFFTSVTTLISQTTPTSPFLIKWMAEMGYEESQVFAQERADYGTFLHSVIASLLINRRYNTDKLQDELKEFMEVNKLPSGFIKHTDELKKDILAFAQFMIENNVRPLAIEVVLTHPKDGYAGAIDLVCEMEILETGDFGQVYKTGERAGQTKLTKGYRKILALVDFKSGRKGFYEEHEIQLECYRQMWNYHYPKLHIERVFNWSPKNWRGITPTYNLKEQTNSIAKDKLPHLVEIARVVDRKKNNTISVVEGEIVLENGLDENVKSIELEDLVRQSRENKLKKKK